MFLSLVSIIYYFGFFSPQQQKARLAFQKSQSDRLVSCMTDAENKYNGSWKQECQAYGFKEGCRLPLDVASRVDGKRQFDKNSCLEQYPMEEKEEKGESKSFNFNPFTFFAPSE